jgi:hypothetical protein
VCDDVLRVCDVALCMFVRERSVLRTSVRNIFTSVSKILENSILDTGLTCISIHVCGIRLLNMVNL